MVKEIINDVIGNMFPTTISPIFAHLVSYTNLGKVSQKPIELRKAQKQPKRLKKKEKTGFRMRNFYLKLINLKMMVTYIITYITSLKNQIFKKLRNILVKQ